jgi:hypothetical protein
MDVSRFGLGEMVQRPENHDGPTSRKLIASSTKAADAETADLVERLMGEKKGDGTSTDISGKPSFVLSWIEL